MKVLALLVALLSPVSPDPGQHDTQEPPCAAPGCHQGYPPDTPPPSGEKE